ncbi:MAG: ADP-ribosylglycohydrolase family protein [Anaerolineae bacterium]|nr:ADP-ribosylglycohydrolase family protein [Anaerolineae bacterium]
MRLELNSPSFRNKIYGCWLGKNSGGTLGTPLEGKWGSPEMFDIWWYPEVKEGGMPNDDLEMQLIWLKALEEVGTDLKAADLAEYWLSHIGYNWDEYGMSKTNLRLGLVPPVSGAYNNYFKDCMGCPIRSEIWACIAPGVPQLAVRYAVEDALCDHAGGESVYGELFNTAIESAAFVISDPNQLLDIGLSYVPSDSQTAKAIRAAREAYANGLDWKAARQAVYEATPHATAQYSPINMGFQVIGWLYGDDFGDAICKAVNCGYDTDCTGGTLGSYLGIILGQSGLPENWIAPLGDEISTNGSWGGIRNEQTPTNPLPTNLTELTDRVIAMAHKVLRAHGYMGDDPVIDVTPESLYAPDSIAALWKADPMIVSYPQGVMDVAIHYGDSPAVIAKTTKHVETELTNRTPDPLLVTGSFVVPDGWASPAPQQIEIPPYETARLGWDLAIPAETTLDISNRLLFSVRVAERMAQPAVPVTLIAASKYRVAGPYKDDGSEEVWMTQSFEPEQASGDDPASLRPGSWATVHAPDNAIPVEFNTAGVMYVQQWLWSPSEQAVHFAISATCPLKFWVNGDLKAECKRYLPLRPDYRGEEDTSATVDLKAGWNELLIKYVRGPQAPAFATHLALSDGLPLTNGNTDLLRMRFPWD